MFWRAHEVTSNSKRFAWAFLVWCLLRGSPIRCGVNGQVVRIFQPSSWTRLDSLECPESCKDVFLMLKDGPTSAAGKVQHVVIQERGEPKSGTGFMFEWAVGALAHTCMYLQSAYGGKSCRIESSHSNRTLVFDAQLAAKDPGPCACENVDRVIITMSNIGKHRFPVEDGCNWSRGGGISNALGNTCSTHRGTARLQNKDELWECVENSMCRITDTNLQMAVMRDPRAVAVSAYFHHLHENPLVVEGKSVDDFALDLLPTVCQWVSIRYLLFSVILAATSKIFWYDDAKAYSLEWHQQLLDFVGLRVPDNVVSKAAAAAERGGHILGLPAKGIDEHEGGLEATANRSYTDEVTAVTLEQMDSVLRLWLPAAVLEHLGLGV